MTTELREQLKRLKKLSRLAPKRKEEGIIKVKRDNMEVRVIFFYIPIGIGRKKVWRFFLFLPKWNVFVVLLVSSNSPLETKASKPTDSSYREIACMKKED